VWRKLKASFCELNYTDMKIRTSFVSNSSASSYTVFVHFAEQEKMLSELKELEKDALWALSLPRKVYGKSVRIWNYCDGDIGDDDECIQDYLEEHLPGDILSRIQQESGNTPIEVWNWLEMFYKKVNNLADFKQGVAI